MKGHLFSPIINNRGGKAKNNLAGERNIYFINFFFHPVSESQKKKSILCEQGEFFRPFPPLINIKIVTYKHLTITGYYRFLWASHTPTFQLHPLALTILLRWWWTIFRKLRWRSNTWFCCTASYKVIFPVEKIMPLICIHWDSRSASKVV